MKMIFILLTCLSFNLYGITSDLVNDSKSGLMWQDDKDANTLKMDWDSAIEYCEEYTLDGFDDWHLPTAEELLTITDKSLYDPAIKKEFNNVTSHKYWTSSSAMDEIFAWSVDFKFGRTSSPRDKSTELFVRCTRVGQYNTLPFDTLVAKILKQNSDEEVRERDESFFTRAEDENISQFEERVKKSRAIKRTLEVTWGKPLINDLEYDRVKRHFRAKLSFEANKDFMKDVIIDVPSRYWRKFKSSIHTLNTEAIFDYDNDILKLKNVKVTYYGRGYTLEFVDIDEDELIVSANVSNKFDEEGLKHFNELDQLLAQSRRAEVDPKKWLFVIGVENYDFSDCVTYAKRSAVLFAKSAQKRLGVSIDHTYLMVNNSATEVRIKRNLNKMLKRVKRGDTIYFYYNGHGLLAKELNNEPFLLASDTDPKDITEDKFFSLKNIYSRLSYSRATKVIAFIDSGFYCMSDEKSDTLTNEEIPSVRFNQNKMVILNATSKGKANAYELKAHRLFSYYVIKDIIDGTKHIKGFFKDVKNQVYENSLQNYGESKAQEPSIHGNLRLTL